MGEWANNIASTPPAARSADRRCDSADRDAQVLLGGAGPRPNAGVLKATKM
jgi:hypothetical protein